MVHFQVTNDNYKSFLSGWKDNKVRALFFGSGAVPTLRFVMAAFAHRTYAQFGYVRLSRAETSELQSRYNVRHYDETLLMFKEDFNQPAATVAVRFILPIH